MNDEERLKELEELRRIARSLQKLPKLLEKFHRLKFRLTWLMREQESVPRWLIPSFEPRKINVVTDVLSALEHRIADRGNHSSGKSNSVSAE